MGQCDSLCSCSEAISLSNSMPAASSGLMISSVVSMFEFELKPTDCGEERELLMICAGGINVLDQGSKMCFFPTLYAISLLMF